MITKICSKCKLEKELSEFGKQKRGKFGVRAICFECRRRQYQDNREDVLLKQKKYRKKNKEAISAKRKKWRQDNPEKQKEKKKKEYQRNAEAYKKRWKNYRDCNPERAKEIKKREYEKNKPAYFERARKRRALKSQVNENFTPEMEAIVRKTFDNKCFNCDSQDNLCIDHHRPLIDGNPLELGNAVLLCRSCNSSKGPKQPHQFYNGLTLMILDYILQQQETYIDVNLNN